MLTRLDFVVRSVFATGMLISPDFPSKSVQKKQNFGSIEPVDAVYGSFTVFDLENQIGESRKDALRVNFD